MDFKDAIRTIPDYPKPGIMFRDITTLLGNARAFRRAVDELVQPYAGLKIDKVAGLEARGFILGGAVAHQLSVGFIPVRKKGKLPHTVIGEDYDLEYGKDRVEIHDLHKSFGQQRVLDGIELQVERGETLAVLDRSGTGKSVLLKLIIGLQKPDSGSIRVAGATPSRA